MNIFKRTFKSTSIIVAIVMLLVPTAHQFASAALIGTENVLQAENNQAPRDYLSQLMDRNEVKNALIARGVDPQEAQLRLQSLTDEEIRLIAMKIDDLSAGQGVVIFSLIILAVIIATVLLFNFTGVTDVFP
jgi:hypothetical protein